MFFYTVKEDLSEDYCFCGPFETKDCVWDKMRNEAEHEYMIVCAENGRNAPIDIDKENCKIVITDEFWAECPKTTYLAFELDI